MKKLELTVIIEKGENGYYVGQVQEYPAALSQGKTIEDLMINIKDALLLILDTQKESLNKTYATRKIFKRRLDIAL